MPSKFCIWDQKIMEFYFFYLSILFYLFIYVAFIMVALSYALISAAATLLAGMIFWLNIWLPY